MSPDKTDEMDLLREMVQVRGPVETQEETHKRISTDHFKTTNKDTRLWLSENKALCEMHDIAVEDYIVSRHAVLELGLFRSGLALAAQAVEKFLKCYLLAADLPLEDIRKTYNHDIQSLLKKAHETSQQKDLLIYSNFCNDLVKWYNSRYPESRDPASQWMRNAIPELDKFVCYLEEHMPIPPAITHLKNGGGEMGHQWSSIFVRLFAATFSQHRAALLNENAVLLSRLNELEKQFLANRLAAVIPASTLDESMEHSDRVQAVIRKHEQHGRLG